MDPLEQSVSDVLAATGRQSPDLGGGAASIISALIGLSLIRLATATTGEKTEADLSPMLGRIDRLSGRLEQLARADVAVFRKYVAALGLPHETQGEERARDAALRNTGSEAAETPLKAAFLIVEGLEIAGEIAPDSHAEVSSDVYAGAAILNGAFLGGLATFEINLKPRRMAEQRSTLLSQKEELLARRTKAMSALSQIADTNGYLVA